MARRYNNKFTTRRKVLVVLNLVLLVYTLYAFYGRDTLVVEKPMQAENKAERLLKDSLRSSAGSSSSSSSGSGEGKVVEVSKEEQARDLRELVELFGLEDESEFFEMFEDAEEYLAAPRIQVRPYTRMDYQKRWNRLYAHVQCK